MAKEWIRCKPPSLGEEKQSSSFAALAAALL